MNLAGKIFTLLIFIMSLVLVSLTLTIYVTHTNWRMVADNEKEEMLALGHPLGYKQQLAAAEQENEELRVLNDDLKDHLETEKELKRKAVTGLENELAIQREDIAKLQKELDDKREAIRVAISSAEKAQKQAEQLASENVEIRKQIAAVLLDRDKEVNKNIELTDKVYEVRRQIGELQKRSDALNSELSQAKQVMSYLNLKPDVFYYRSLTSPTGLRGQITAVDLDRKMVEISVGSDDGVREGHRFEVQTADGTSYVGRVLVLEVFPDKAICEHIPGFEHGTYAKGNVVIPVTAGLKKKGEN